MLATNQQIIDLFQARHGTDLNPVSDNEGAGSRQFRRLKAAFVSTDGRAASKVELLRTLKLGVRGQATVYRLTGLRLAFQ